MVSGHGTGGPHLVDKQMVKLIVDEYVGDIEFCLPDLSACVCSDPFNPDYDKLRDALQDMAADYIHDRLQGTGDCSVIPEIREAAKVIAYRYCGEPE